MYNLKRLYNQNRKKIWKTIIIIASALLLLMLINQIVKQYNEQKKQNEQNTIIENVTSSYKEDYTAISGKEVKEDVAKQNSDIIKEFIEFCNKKDIEHAYNLLSNDCKEVNYPTIDIFKTNYLDMIFTNTKSYNQEGWMTKNNRYTYRITIIDDPLSTGTVNYNNSFQDFYTLVEENDETKLNISSYVAREELNKMTSINDVTINAKYRDSYMDYEEYVFEVINNSGKAVALDSKENDDTLYLLGESNNKYSCFNNEITLNYYNILSEDKDETEDIKSITTSVVVPSNAKKYIKIKFNKMYNPERKIKAIEFSDFINDYEEYVSISNKKMYNARQLVRIDI